MIRPAAGSAGGRPAASGSARTGARTRGLLRAAVLPVLLATAGALAPPASAAPPAAVTTNLPATTTLPVTTNLPGTTELTVPAADDDPVRITVSRFDPRTLTPGSKVTVTGTLTNTGEETIEDVAVRLQRGDVLLSRAALVQADEDGDEPGTVVTAFQPVEGDLEPGVPVPFTYSIESEELRTDQDGVYPVLLNVNGSIDGDASRVGELSTFVVQQPQIPSATTAVAWLWPLTERSHRSATGGFADDGLAESISAEGRLDRALGVVERLPRETAPGAATPVSVVPVTLAIDPALVEELQLMADGGYEVPGGQGTGSEAAEKFLARLRDVAALHPVVALPYGDVDVDALGAVGLGGVVTRSLPGSPAGTAQDPQRDDAPVVPAPTTAGGSGAPEGTAEPEEGAGARILAEALEVEPRTDLAWAPGGSLLGGSLDLLVREGGVDQVVLGPEGLTSGGSAVGLTDRTAAAASSVVTATGAVPALVADSRLGDVVAGSQRVAGGPRIAEQRYLAELALLTAQAPPGTEQTVLVAPPRDVDAAPDGAGAMMAASTSLPWLRPVALDALAGPQPTEAGDLVEPADPVQLDSGGLATVRDVVLSRDDLAAAVEGDADTALEALDAAVARSVSVAWRTDAEGFRQGAADLSATVKRMRGQVTLLAPADGTYTLASSDAPLVLTVRNDLPFAVRVLPEVRARGNRALSIGDIGVRVLAPGERATLLVPTSLGQSGGFAVEAALTTPGGSPLGERVQLQVRSTAYGPISLIITIGAASLLAVLFLRRLVHFVLRRRGHGAGTDDAPAADTAAPPPTRSPV